MTQPPAALQQFLASFARHSEDDDPATVVAHFADTFLAAGPEGARPVRSADFPLILARRKQLFRELGHQSSTLLSVSATPLDARYVLAATQWNLRFLRPSATPDDIQVQSTFLIDTGSDPFRILLYLAHQDVLALLRERGLQHD